jgi:hypothetical protein
MMKPVNYYGCVQCQQCHLEDTEPDIYNLHFMRQDKHGVKELYETMDERRKRYEERFLGACAK